MRKDTVLAHSGRSSERPGPVNVPVYRASTVVFESVEATERATQSRFEGLYYGRYGTPTTFALEETVAQLEGGYRAIAVSSGLAAITATIQAFAKSGDHILVPDSVYGPVRHLCDSVLDGLGITTAYYDPLAGARIEAQLRPNTRLLYLESPGSLTFEVQDVPAMLAVARKRAIPTAIDNTWATPYYYSAVAAGVDVSLHSGTKYIGGHSDLLLGMIVTNEAVYEKVRATVVALGFSCSADEAYLALRGLRTLGVRLERHYASGLAVAKWLERRPEVARILHPAFASCPGHELWKRDFSGASGLFSFVLRPGFTRDSIRAMIDGLEFFSIGYSWGGFESLALLAHPEKVRTATPWTEPGAVIRLHIGLEDPHDLIADLERGFSRLVTGPSRTR
ncbi:MAG TPA: cystathionine beta-lyase [Candidatus Binatia bacterium]|nr:cystathionine beta-lyase [Candidatus Binatia bacterium]